MYSHGPDSLSRSAQPSPFKMMGASSRVVDGGVTALMRPSWSMIDAELKLGPSRRNRRVVRYCTDRNGICLLLSVTRHKEWSKSC